MAERAPDLMAALSAAALSVVHEKLRDATRLADDYVEACAAFYVGPKSYSRRPTPPAGLDHRVAAMIREEVEEAALVERASLKSIEARPRRSAAERVRRAA